MQSSTSAGRGGQVDMVVEDQGAPENPCRSYHYVTLDGLRPEEEIPLSHATPFPTALLFFPASSRFSWERCPVNSLSKRT